MAGEVQEIDHGWRRIQRAFRASGGSMASRVGVQGSEAEEKSHSSQMTNVRLFAIHEFGKGRVPERSVFRTTFDEHMRKYRSDLRELGDDMITGKQTPEAGLRLLGEEYRSDMITKVKSGKVTPPLAPATVAARVDKGGKRATENIPLWDTGQMVGALTTVLER